RRGNTGCVSSGCVADAPTCGPPGPVVLTRTGVPPELEVLAGRLVVALLRSGRSCLWVPRHRTAAWDARPTTGQSQPDLLQLLLGSHLLRHDRGLDAVEQSLQPTHQLSLGNAVLGRAEF